MGVAEKDSVEGNTHHLSHQWQGDTTVSETIVTAVAEHAGVGHESLPPMGHSINPDALDTLFEAGPESAPAPGCVTFSYYGYTVVVRSTGQILLREN